MYNAEQPSHDAYFEELEDVVKEHLLAASESVRICVAWINYERYRSVFSALVDRGIPVDVIINDDNTNARGFPEAVDGVRLRRMTSREGIMHSKFCVIDEHVVVSGSYNWSINATKHFEHLTVSRHDYPFASGFIGQFDRLWEVAAAAVDEPEVCGCQEEGERPCRSHTFALGVMGEPEGQYENCDVAIWRVCYAHQHARFVMETSEDHLRGHLGMDTENWPDRDEDGVSIESEASWRRQRQRVVQSSKRYFSSIAGVPVQAVGHRVMANWNEHMEWDEDPVYALMISAKDTRNAYRIRSLYEADGTGMEDVIDDFRRRW